MKRGNDCGVVNAIPPSERKRLNYLQGAKGWVQFPFDQPPPLEVIGRIVQLRVIENLSLAEKKSARARSR